VEQLTPQGDPDVFFARLEQYQQGILLLDYDGTLAPFRKERHKAVPYPGVLKLLSELVAQPRLRVVIISGRSVDDLKPLLNIDPLPEIRGSHGLERWHPKSGYVRQALTPKAEAGLEAAAVWAEANNLRDRVERKPGGIAFHWRGIRELDQKATENQITAHLTADVIGPDLEILPFDGGLELRATGVNKGNAVADILREHAPDTPVAYFGDDQTDEDAFRAMPPHGLKVIVRKELRDTLADLWLVPPDDLTALLARFRHTGA